MLLLLLSSSPFPFFLFSAPLSFPLYTHPFSSLHPINLTYATSSSAANSNSTTAAIHHISITAPQLHNTCTITTSSLYCRHNYHGSSSASPPSILTCNSISSLQQINSQADNSININAATITQHDAASLCAPASLLPSTQAEPVLCSVLCAPAPLTPATQYPPRGCNPPLSP